MDITPNGTRLALSEHGAKLISLKQECIPVGCVPPTSVAVLEEGGGRHPPDRPSPGQTPPGQTPPAPLHADIHPMPVACWDTTHNATVASGNYIFY